MTKLEQVAKSILDVMEIEIDGIVSDRVLLLITRAAVEALRDPGDAATLAGVDYRLATTFSGGNTWSRDTRLLWQAMIDAIINEGDK